MRTCRPAGRRPVAAQRQLRDHRPPRSRQPDAHRRRAPHLAEHLARAAASTLQFHLYYNAWRNSRSTWMRERASPATRALAERPEARLGLDRRHQPARDRRWRHAGRSDLARSASSPPTTGTRTTGRWWRCRSTRRWRPGETINVQIAWSSRVPRTFARTGAIGNFYFIAQWFPKIGVLEDSGLELPPVPCGDRVLRRLRHLRRPADGAAAAGSSARPAVERDRRDEADGTTTHHYYAGRRPRFRVDDEPGLRRAAPRRSSIRRCRRSTCGCCCSPSTPARPSGISPRRARRSSTTASGSAPTRTATSPIVDPAWQSDAGRHGVPDALHRRHALAGAARRRRARRRRRSTRPGHQFWYGHRRHQRVRARVDGRRVQHLLDRARRSSRRSSRTTTRSATSAASSRGCSAIFR